MKLVSILDFYILFVIIIKVIFILIAIFYFVSSHDYNNPNIFTLSPTLLYWKKRVEFVFVVSMALLLIICFRPGSTVRLTEETKILFFVYGLVLFITSNWDIFIYEAPWYKNIINILKNN